MSVPTARLHLALALLSVAVVVLQLVLMRLLAITQWHHFAFLAISLALLGFGAAGTVIALTRNWLLERLDALLPLLCFASAAATVAAAGGALSAAGGFDSYLVFADPLQFWRLLTVSLLLALPFFLAALVLGLVFVAQVEHIGTLYFANLLGSGLGGAIALLLLAGFSPGRLPAAAALFVLAAGLLLLPRSGRPWLPAWALAAGLAATVGLFRPPDLALSPYKEIRRALELPASHLVAERSSPLGLVQAVSGPALRWAPGLSLAWEGEVPATPMLYVDGNSFGPVVPWPPEAAGRLLDQTTGALPYALTTPASVLVLHAGTGAEVAHALSHGARRVVAVEPQRAALRLMAEAFPASGGALLHHTAVTVVPLEPRTHLAADESRYDLIVLPTVGAFGGTAGLFALQEQPLLTREGFATLWRRLAPGGLLAVTVWMDYPPRAPLRLAATMAEAVAAEDVADPTAHLAAVRGWGTITFCLKRSPLTPDEIAAVRDFAGRLLFDPLLLPGLEPDERQRHNSIQDPDFLASLDRLLTPARDELYATYPFRLRPPTDDRPFFSQFLRWRSLPHLARIFGERTLPFLELGYLLVGLACVEMAAVSILLILLPLLRLGWREGRRWPVGLYFGGLAVGYMLVEIGFIHRFVLYLGHPVYAAAAVIAALLVFSGAGSWCSSRREPTPGALQRAAALITALLLLYALLLPAVLRATVALPAGWKIILSLGLLAPVAFAMGFPFPLGLRLLGRQNESDVPWAWGVNGCLSVVSTALATLIAVEAGFTAVQLTAAGAYAVAAATRLRN